MSDENQAQEIFDQVMVELSNEAAQEASATVESDETVTDTTAKVDYRGDAAYQAKEEFGKKTTYIPSEGHPVWNVLKDARDLCTESANLDAMKVEIGLTFVYPSLAGPDTYAHILKPNRLLKMHSGLQLIVEISGTSWDKMTENERLALLHHELEHVNFKEKRNGDLELRLVDHNVKDFAKILDLYGIYYIRAGLNEE